MNCTNCIYNLSIQKNGRIELNKATTYIECEKECERPKHSPSRMMHEALKEENKR